MTSYHPTGTFCWTELQTNAPLASSNYYRSLFGWEARELADGRGSAGFIQSIGNRRVASIAPFHPRLDAMDEPALWLCHIAVSDIHETLAMAVQLGATVVIAPTLSRTGGRMAVLQDPADALIALWQSDTEIGARAVDEPGTPGWFELASSDLERAAPFYADLFGWRYTYLPERGGDRLCAELAGRWVGGLSEARGDLGGRASRWIPYFAVRHPGVTLAQAEVLAGHSVRFAPQPRSAEGSEVATDRERALFGLVRYVASSATDTALEV